MSEDKREATTKERKNQKSWCGQCPVLLGRVREGRNGFHLRFYIIQSKDERHPPDRDRIEEFPQHALGRAFIEGRFVTLNVVSHSYNGEKISRLRVIRLSHPLSNSFVELMRRRTLPPCRLRHPSTLRGYTKRERKRRLKRKETADFMGQRILDEGCMEVQLDVGQDEEKPPAEHSRSPM